ncbi:hypothetical protein QQF64_008043 [Cirrhinus molitorella]|uniref:Tyr recombinase domain-containing protein n=1 Tax=Cirrhinus molitorella TaxID=172907 RepID=A0ABR3M7J2_9TELE
MTLQSHLRSAARYMRSGLAKSTLKMYDSAWFHFSSFFAIFSVAVMPVTETNTAFCPLSSMLAYLRSRPKAGQQEPLFLTEEGKPMSRAWFASRLRLLCKYCALPPECYTAHSFHIGAATTAASSTPVSTLKAMGRWSSAAYECYLRPDAQIILEVQKAMSATP